MLKIEKCVTVVKAVLALSVVTMAAFVAGCGGGGDGGGSTSSNNGGSTSGPNQQPIAANAANTVPIAVNSGISNNINIPTVTVTICAPNSTTNCVTVNNVLLDTGSYGVRIVNTALGSLGALNGGLPTQQATAGGTLAECTHFADGFSWGSTRKATVKIGGEVANNIPIQVIGDLPVPSGCMGVQAENTAQDLGANGILGIGVAPVDCGNACANSVALSNYFACPNNTNCVTTLAEPAKQVANPVPNFATDKNGVIVQMAPINSSNGVSSATGTLVFGIGTQSNNANAAATTYTTNASGDLSNSTFNGATIRTFMDSGSNGYFFPDNSLTVCPANSNVPDFYCPSTPQTRTINLVGLNGAKGSATLNISNAQTLVNSGNLAFNNLAGQIGMNAVDLGLPFFFGRYVYYGMDQTSNGSGPQAPFVAF